MTRDSKTPTAFPVVPGTLRRMLGDEGADAVAYQRRSAYQHHPGQDGIDPTRYGDWEYNGRCSDFF